MKTLFSLISCPFCNTASLAVLHANCNLPLDKQIKIIEVLPNEINGKAIGDARLAFLAELNKSTSVQEWGFPILALDTVGLKLDKGMVNLGSTGRVMIHSAYSHNHYKKFLEHYLL